MLADDGWLVIYNSGFLGQLHGEDDFAQWHRSVYLARYPTPPRSHSSVTEEFVRPFGFTLVQTETHDQEISMSRRPVRRLSPDAKQRHRQSSNRGRNNLEMVAQFLADERRPRIFTRAEMAAT